MSAKSLVAYYSSKGSAGNTGIVALKIQQATGSDIFQIQTKKTYPDDYTQTTTLAKQELKDKARPELLRALENPSRYDVIYLGYPCWWGTMPMGVFTFLETTDLSGKTLVPFCTHGGSGLSNSVKDLKEACPKSKVLAGIAIRGASAGTSDGDITSWLKKNGLK
jgi:flavodoxin